MSQSLFLECPACKQPLPLNEFLNSCRAYWPQLRVTLQVCPLCRAKNEVEIEPGEVWFGYVYAAGSAHFSREILCEVPISGRLAVAEGLRIYAEEREWLVPNASGVTS